ncbi:hypothetical protein TL16_g11099 [Triparma laevis f. inornata]|uniref:Amidase domain-containing protein n=1 Tax=Triparma laevis f. inornata TaxID=1714386 RepID=A0A9W7BGR9_9STRA|nr:hypothetical protein TL16_g11099 [Triparma laevis f. inornata]
MVFLIFQTERALVIEITQIFNDPMANDYIFIDVDKISTEGLIPMLLLPVATIFLVLHLQKTGRAESLRGLAKAARLRRQKKDHEKVFDHYKSKKLDHDDFAYLPLEEYSELSRKDVVAALSYRLSTFLSWRKKGGVNALTEELYAEAFAGKKGKGKGSVGLLEGVPITVKDCIGVAGCLSTGGLSVRADPAKISESNAHVVQTLVDQGAIILARGNTSQCMMLPESHNNVWGESKNPWDKTRTPGGSSGGDAVTVATGCVPLSVGSDVGGSIRIPAAFCGIPGFKPTPGRISKLGCMSPRLKDRHGMAMVIPSTIGPMAESVEACKTFCEAVWTDEHFEGDTSLPPKVFDHEEYEKKGKLKLAYFKSDGWFEPCSAALRGLEETVAKLKKAGHKVQEIEFPGDGWKTYQLYVALSAAEGDMKGFTLGLEGEDLIPEYVQLKQASSLPNFLRPLISRLLDKRRGSLVNNSRSGGISSYDLQQRMADVLELRKFWSKTYKELGVDAILHVALPLPALKCGTSGDLTGAFSYTLLGNLILFPAGVVPVTTIHEDEQEYPMENLPENQRDHWAKKAQACMEGSTGMPMSVAIMTDMYRDEKCLRIMKEVERVVDFDETPEAWRE